MFKDSKNKLIRDFEFILNKREIQNLKNYIKNFRNLIINNIIKKIKIFIKYNFISYNNKKLRENDNDFPPGYTFKFYFIIILGMMNCSILNINNFNKRRKFNYF